MDKQQTLHIIQTLANGVDLTTGEVFPADSPYQNVEIVRALFHAAKIIEEVKNLPDNAGSAWTNEEQEKIIIDYQNDVPIAQIAKNLQRKPGAIRSRLKKVGVIQN